MEQMTGKLFYDMYPVLDGQDVTVTGWVKTKRIGKAVAFLEISDGTTLRPIQKKRHSSEFLRTIPHLRPRTNLYAAVFRTYSVMMRGITKFLDEEGFVQIHTPIMTACDGEGAGEVFKLKTEKFYGQEAYLAVTGQLHLEAMALSLRKVYDFCPSFRAEDSNTPRNLRELPIKKPLTF